MRKDFPLFQTHLDFVKPFWEKILDREGAVIDATLGNGKDALFLYRLIQNQRNAKLYAFDIQDLAIEKAKQHFDSEEPGWQEERVAFIKASHDRFEDFQFDHPIVLIVYNLGFLPGGDKAKTTMRKTTLDSLASALSLIAKGGLISLTCYPGHEEGAEEEKAVYEFLKTCPKDTFSITSHEFINRQKAPIVYFIQKKCQKEPDSTSLSG